MATTAKTSSKRRPLSPARRAAANKRRRDARRDKKNEAKVETKWEGAAPVPETHLPPLTGALVVEIVRRQLAQEYGMSPLSARSVAPGRNDYENCDGQLVSGNRDRAESRGTCSPSPREVPGPARDKAPLEVAADRILGRAIEASNIRNIIQQLTSRITGTMMPCDPQRGTDEKESQAPLHLLGRHTDHLTYQLEQLRQEVEFLNAHL